MPFNLPYREDQYVTNSFEYLAISELFEQWSHSFMAEARVTALPQIEIFADGELWLRYAAARGEPGRVVYTPDGFRAPGRALGFFYRAGLSLYPWPAYPHRLNAFLTNKQVASGISSADPVPLRYDPGTYVVFELEAYL
jgi:hypothetical protein